MYFNLNVGGGIERTGRVVETMLPDAHVYRQQNPGCIIAEELARLQPDVIVMNEQFPRVMEAVYYYRLTHKCNVILLNHCYDCINGRRVDDPDRRLLVRRFLRQIDTILNLNYVPENAKLLRNVIRMYHPCNPKFRLKIPWDERPKKCLYWGNLAPHKFNVKFLELYDDIDVYGRIRCDGEYKDRLLESGCYRGYLPEERLVDTINEYKYFVVPHDGYEPFMLTLQEAMQCGTIPLVTNSRDYPKSYWIDWAKGLYIEFRDVWQLSRWLRRDRDLTQMSYGIAREIRRRHSYDRFKKVLWSLIKRKLSWEVMV
ncbi:MAG: hypothetical protein DRJ38_00125 [Thermoprotei archaeon]|nr:MAG: hypothetical protein DRJ38_00125 [Thermoprotei archaeon]